MAVGAGRRPGRYLPAPAVPRREAPVKEVAPSCLAFWGGDSLSQPLYPPHARTAARPRGCAQPVRARGTSLGGGCAESRTPAAPTVLPRLSFEPGVALPAFWGRRAPADQVDSLRRLVLGSGVPGRHDRRALRSGYHARCHRGRADPALAAAPPGRRLAERRRYLYRHRLRGLEVPPLRHRSHHQPYPRLRRSYRYARSCVLRWRGNNSDHFPHPYRPTPPPASTSHSRLHPSDSSAIQPLERPHTGL